jgi:hypothetical protein
MVVTGAIGGSGVMGLRAYRTCHRTLTGHAGGEAYDGLMRIVAVVLACAVAVAGQALSLSVDDHRPLSALAGELEKRYSIVVTYEDCRLTPRKTAVSFEYAPPADGRSAAVLDVLTEMLAQYHASGAPGHFRVEGGNGRYHLIPLDGPALFDLPVTLAEEERTVDSTLDEIAAQINAASGRQLGWGFVPLNLFNQTRVRIGAWGEPARNVIRRILEKVPQRVTWRLNYDPLTGRYYLNFLILHDLP